LRKRSFFAENHLMKTLAPFRRALGSASRRGRISFRATFFCMAVLLLTLTAFAQSATAVKAVTIVLPPKVVAGHPATLAVLGADGHLAPNVAVDMGPNLRVTTDRTGRALFVVPASGAALIAKASGATAVALIDAPRISPAPAAMASVTSVAGLHDPFAICAAGLSGDADANLVKISGDFALVLAASPECIVALAPPKAAAGAAKVSVEVSPTQATPKISTSGSLMFVSLEFAPPVPALQPGKKSRFAVNVRGSEQSLRVVVENESPGVLAFSRGDSQELRTTGGAHNFAEFEVQATRSGDFKFHARVLPVTDTGTAVRYLQAAAAIAPTNLQNNMKSIADRLAQHPNEAEKIRAHLESFIAASDAGDFRALLTAAHSAL
jgi:hypothetical protein